MKSQRQTTLGEVDLHAVRSVVRTAANIGS
jgi:hypothetical protein